MMPDEMGGAKEDAAEGGGLRLGFGGSALIAGRTRRESRMLLDAAWDAGIRHYDTARVYGSGDAEAILGSFAESRRSELTIVTKFGIQPIVAGTGGTIAKSALRHVIRRSRTLGEFARRQSRRTNKQGRFGAADARISLETSLRQLRSDYVDVLLMHDCAADDWLAPETQEALSGLLQTDRIRAFGTATGFDVTKDLLTRPGPKPMVAQFDSNARSRNARCIATLDPHRRQITYGALSGIHPTLLAALRARPERRQYWSRVLDLDLANDDQVGILLLAHALWQTSSGVVIFFSGDPRRIATNASVIREQRLHPSQLEGFERLVLELLDADRGCGTDNDEHE